MAAGLLCFLLSYLWLFDPAEGGYLVCPFHWVTGWLCPGCGIQSAFYALLHGRLGEAFTHNGLFVFSLPALVIQWGYLHQFPDHNSLRVRKWTLTIWVALTLGWGLVRNLM